MGSRFVVDSDGFRWDRVHVLDIERPDQPLRRTIAVTGLVQGDDGALLLHLPGVLDRCFAVDPNEARALRDALVARVGGAREPDGWTDDLPPDPLSPSR